MPLLQMYNFNDKTILTANECQMNFLNSEERNTRSYDRKKKKKGRQLYKNTKRDKNLAGRYQGGLNNENILR